MVMHDEMGKNISSKMNLEGTSIYQHLNIHCA